MEWNYNLVSGFSAEDVRMRAVVWLESPKSEEWNAKDEIVARVEDDS